MQDVSPAIKFIFNLAKVQSLLTRRFDGGLGGLGFNEFMILYHLNLAPGGKLRRIDLAGKVGLTASGITRLLLPMEKIGLVSKQVNPKDARVSLVLLAPGGKMKLEEAIENAEMLAREIIPQQRAGSIKELTDTLTDISGTIY